MTKHHGTRRLYKNTMSLLFALVIALSPAAAAASELSVAADGSLAESTSEQQAAITTAPQEPTITPDEVTPEPPTQEAQEPTTQIIESEALEPGAADEVISDPLAEPGIIPAGDVPEATLIEPPEETPAVSAETDIAMEQKAEISSISGSVSASDTRKLGDVSTGSAVATSNMLNIIQSDTAIAEDGGLLTFTRDIQGDVVGDILIDPGALDPANKQTQVDVNTTSNQQLSNTVNVSAQSGSISLEKNRSVGDVSSGPSDAVANVVNLINSAVSSGKSFFGVINILGNLDGDILLPEDFIDGLLGASGQTKTSSTPESYVINPSDQGDTSQGSSSNISINNDVSLNAASGSVSADNVRKIGDITTGNAATNLTIYNLAGTKVTGKNTLLVFVNVLGTWTGFIIDAPAGATSAALGGSTSTTPIGHTIYGDINSVTNSTINNSVTVSAQSGDIALANGHRVGNVATGNATASANILNIVQSQLSLAEWFGVLFINVFGSWNGSFGVNTAAGDPPLSEPADNNGPGKSTPVLVSFIPEGSTTQEIETTASAVLASYRPTTSPSSSDQPIDTGTVLASVIPPSTPTSEPLNDEQTENSQKANYTLVLLIVGGSAFAVVGYRLLATRGTM